MTGPKLECYALHDPSPQLVAAAADRDWMDATNQHFAYRCTPLSIANASGWEVLNPVGFSATWTGWNGKQDVILRPHETGVNLRHTGLFFGHGILSFHPGYLFRTRSRLDNVGSWLSQPSQGWDPAARRHRRNLHGCRSPSP